MGSFILTYSSRLKSGPSVHNIPAAFHYSLSYPIANKHEIRLLSYHLHILKVSPSFYMYHKPVPFIHNTSQTLLNLFNFTHLKFDTILFKLIFKQVKLSELKEI